MQDAECYALPATLCTQSGVPTVFPEAHLTCVDRGLGLFQNRLLSQGSVLQMGPDQPR